MLASVVKALAWTWSREQLLYYIEFQPIMNLKHFTDTLKNFNNFDSPRVCLLHLLVLFHWGPVLRDWRPTAEFKLVVHAYLLSSILFILQ